jgi:hypothetical protein
MHLLDTGQVFFWIGAAGGVALFAVLLWLDPGPGPRRLAIREAWARHEARVERSKAGWPWTLMVVLAGGLPPVIGAVGGEFAQSVLGTAAGFAAGLVLTVCGRLLRGRSLGRRGS